MPEKVLSWPENSLGVLRNTRRPVMYGHILNRALSCFLGVQSIKYYSLLFFGGFPY